MNNCITDRPVFNRTMKLFLSFLIIFLAFEPSALVDGVNETNVAGGNETKVDGGGESRIYGGYQIDITDAPWMAYVQYNLKKGYSYCGGTIVNEMFILTAAHCAYEDRKGVLYRNNPSQYEIRIGSSNRHHGGSVYKVAKVIPHPKYEPVDMPHDMALLKLTQNSKGNYKAGEKVSSMGWGDNPENPKSRNIYEVNLNIVDTAQCAKAYGDSTKKYKKHKICAFGPKPKNGDVCEGDSGGPLLHGKNNEQIGVVSYGGDCPQKNGERQPGVYAKIADNLAWIKSVISRSNDKDDEDPDEEECSP